MNATQKNELWAGEGLLWQNITLYNNGTQLIGVMSNARNFMKDREIVFDNGIGIDKAIEMLISEDSEFYDEATLYAEEG